MTRSGRTGRPGRRVETAQQRGQELIRAAREQAEQLVAAAQQDADAAATRYSDAHHRALAAGWTSGDLDALGFTAAAPSRTERPRRGRTQDTVAPAISSLGAGA